MAQVKENVAEHCSRYEKLWRLGKESVEQQGCVGFGVMAVAEIVSSWLSPED